MRLGRIGPLVAAAAMLTLVLAGCEVRDEVGAECTTHPPVPHQNEGFVAYDIHVPLKVAAGSTFTIRVDNLIGYPYVSGPGQLASGTLSVTGAVTPSGTVGVGADIFTGQEGHPETLTYTATGPAGRHDRCRRARRQLGAGPVPGQLLRGELVRDRPRGHDRAGLRLPDPRVKAAVTLRR